MPGRSTRVPACSQWLRCCIAWGAVGCSLVTCAAKFQRHSACCVHLMLADDFDKPREMFYNTFDEVRRMLHRLCVQLSCAQPCVAMLWRPRPDCMALLTCPRKRVSAMHVSFRYSSGCDSGRRDLTACACAAWHASLQLALQRQISSPLLPQSPSGTPFARASPQRSTPPPSGLPLAPRSLPHAIHASWR